MNGKEKFLIIPALAAFFALSIAPLTDPDIWFHLKSGEIIATLGIIHHDVFAFTTAGREWFPYEWLYQIGVYWIKNVFGLSFIPFATALLVSIQLFLMYRIFRSVFGLSVYAGIYVLTFLYVSVYEFISPRPHVLAYTLLVANLSLLITYTVRRKNYLFLSLPITIMWANIHGSVFLDVFFFGAYAAVAWIQYLREPSKEHGSQSKTLAFYTIATGILTVLPPLGFTQYRLLWIFWQQNRLISTFIEEWTPLATNPLGFVYVTVVFTAVTACAVWIAAKTRKMHELLWLLPVTPLLLLTFMASRNAYLGFIAITIILAWSLSRAQNLLQSPLPKRIFAGIGVATLGFFLWLFQQKRIPSPIYYPEGAVRFLQSHQIAGNMFNEYGYGGYLLYHLYPKYKVFFDGRTDLYLCCEMPATLTLSYSKNEPNQQYKQVLDRLWDTYQISFVLIRPEKHSVVRKIGDILAGDPSWRLVYWDDTAQLFVRLDGKNDTLLEQYGVSAATPYSRNPVKTGMEDQALREYRQMIATTDSARSRNAVGYLLLKQQKLDEAKKEFERAIALDPLFESPYMNLSELALHDGNIELAIKGYRLAQRLAPDRGLVYIRLGQLLLQKNGNRNEAREIWEKGVRETTDEDAKQTLTTLLAKP